MAENEGSASTGERPVFVCLEEVSASRRLADGVRDLGLRCRAFADPDVLLNAAAGRPPAAVICSLEQGPRFNEAFAAADQPVELIGILGEEGLKPRLQMAHAGFGACFPRPINLTALVHHLRSSTDAGRARHRLAVVGNAESDLLDIVEKLPEAFEHRHFRPESALLTRIEQYAPHLLIVDGDADRPTSSVLVTALRQYPALAILPVLLFTRGDKRRFDELAARVGLDGLIGLPLPYRDLAAIARARIGQAQRMRRTCDYLAHRDLLTGLFNRAHLSEALSHALAAQAGGNGIVALFHLGIEAEDGDRGVAEAAEILRRQLPPLAVAARSADNTLSVLVAGAGESEVQSLEQQLRGVLVADAHPWRAVIGMAVADGLSRSPEVLLARARDNALPADARAPAATDAGGHWAEAVRAALGQSRFRLVYQPVSSLNGQPGSLFEVFVRLLDEQGREVLPGEFMAAARAAGLGPELDRWVVGRAVGILADRSDTVQPELFVKLLPETLADAGFAGWLCGRLRDEGIDGSRLVLEIAHSALRERREALQRLREEWSASGCRTALEHYDDELDSAPAADASGFEFIKLSPRMTEGISADPRRVERIRRITMAAREQHIHTVATLVQDAGELSTLWQAGLDYIQGYFMQAPSDLFGGTR